MGNLINLNPQDTDPQKAVILLGLFHELPFHEQWPCLTHHSSNPDGKPLPLSLTHSPFLLTPLLAPWLSFVPSRYFAPQALEVPLPFFSSLVALSLVLLPALSQVLEFHPTVHSYFLLLPDQPGYARSGLFQTVAYLGFLDITWQCQTCRSNTPA